MRAALKIPDSFEDDSTIYVTGFAQNLLSHMASFESTFCKMQGAKFCLRFFTYIDPLFRSSVDSEVDRFFTSNKWAMYTPQYGTFAVVPFKFDFMVEDKYEMLARTYAGCLGELQDHCLFEHKRCLTLQEQFDRQDKMHEKIVAGLNDTLDERMQRIEDMEGRLHDKDKLLVEKDNRLFEKDLVLLEQADRIKQMRKQIKEQSHMIALLQEMLNA